MMLNALHLTPHLKQGLGSLYVVIGKEIVLLDDTVQLLAETYAKHHLAQTIEKITVWIEDAKDWEKLTSYTQHYALFKSCLLIRASYQKTTLDQAAKAWLNHFSTQPFTDCIVILQAPHLNIKSLPSVFQNSAHAHTVDVPILKDQALLQFIEKRLQQAELQYHKNVPAFISQLTQGNVLEAVQYIQQLSLVVPASQPVDIDMLKQVVRDVALFPLYTFAETCIQGNTTSMLRQFQRLQQTDTEPLLLLWWLTKVTRQCLHLHHVMHHKENLDTACKTLGIWSSQKQSYLKACQRVSQALLISILKQCKILDTLLKSNPPVYIWDKLEQISLSLCEPTLCSFLFTEERTGT